MDAAKYSKSDLELRSVAYHEAGHAVVAWVKELELHHVTIEAEDFMVGHVTHERFTDEENPEWSESPGTRQRIQDNIQVSLAGAQAQRKLGDDPDSIEHGRAGDAADANRLMALLTEDWDEQGMYWELLKYQTKKMI